MIKATFATRPAVAFATLLLVGLVPASHARDLSSVNGSVEATAGETYDTLSTVNGDVHVRERASADVAKTVNGNVTLEPAARVGSVQAVNGALEIRDGAAVGQEATTVNGGIRIARQARVGGDVTTVSGDIRVAGAEIAGRLQTRNGDIDLTDGARVRGGITVKKKNDNWNWGGDRDQPVKVNICATCEVGGELRFERAVILHVEPGAKIGAVIGDRVTRR